MLTSEYAGRNRSVRETDSRLTPNQRVTCPNCQHRFHVATGQLNMPGAWPDISDPLYTMSPFATFRDNITVVAIPPSPHVEAPRRASPTDSIFAYYLREAQTTTSDIRSIDFTNAVNDLRDSPEAAEQDWGITLESAVIDQAHRVLTSVFEIFPRSWNIYPTPEGEIAIDADTPHGTKVVVTCNLTGAVRCMAYINGEFRSQEYAQVGMGFIATLSEALRQADAVAR